MNDVILQINGEPRAARIEGFPTLLDVLREQLQLTGAKRGCNYGVCGACTVLLDGKPARSCLTLAQMCEHVAVTTVEGVGVNGRLHPVQQCLLDTGAVQCGFCTPGVVLSAKALLDAQPQPSRHEIAVALSGNLCRCSGYGAIVEAISQAALVSREARPAGGDGHVAALDTGAPRG